MLLIAMLVGCGPTWDEFRERDSQAYCSQIVACDEGEMDECISTYMAIIPEDEPESYDPGAAAACIEAREARADEVAADEAACTTETTALREEKEACSEAW